VSEEGRVAPIAFSRNPPCWSLLGRLQMPRSHLPAGRLVSSGLSGPLTSYFASGCEAHEHPAVSGISDSVIM
jgi:hypothetical protein